MGKLEAAAHIPPGIDMLMIGTHSIVHGNTVPIICHTDVLKTQVLNIGRPSHGNKNLFRIQRVAFAGAVKYLDIFASTGFQNLLNGCSQK